MGGRRKKRTLRHVNERKREKVTQHSPNRVETEKIYTKKQQHTYPVPGLNNLGNTCFFNAVLQNLSQTHFLRQRMSSHLSLESYPLSIPSGCVDVKIREVVVKKENGQKTESFANDLYQFLVSMVGMSNRTLNPRNIFNHVCKNAPRFNSYQQQDSYELLGYLWDALKSEEVTKRKLAILESYGVTKNRAIQKALTDEERKAIKCYGLQASMMDTYIEDVFGGKLASFITCHSCNTCSVIHEDILDLTLPVPSDKVTSRHPKSKRKIINNSSDEDEGVGQGITKSRHDKTQHTLSKYQKKQLRKKERKKAHNKKGKDTYSLEELSKIEECSNLTTSTLSPVKLETFPEPSLESDMVKINENLAVVSLKVNELCTEDSHFEVVDDSKEDATSQNRRVDSLKTLALKSLHNSQPKEALVTDDPYNDETPVIHIIDSHCSQSNETPVSRNLYNNLIPVTNDPQCVQPIETPVSDDPHCSQPVETLLTDESQPLTTNEPHCSQGSITQHTENPCCTVLMQEEFNRNQYEEDEYSLESCLAEFSSPEFLKGSNMFCCQVCTERARYNEKPATVTETVLPVREDSSVQCTPPNGIDSCNQKTHKRSITVPKMQLLKQTIESSSSSSGCEQDESKDTESTKESDDDEELDKVDDVKEKDKSQVVYCEATKQLLIDSPPPILCIHLKRFTQLGRNLRNLRKNNVHINFGMHLNLIPYCTEKCKELCDSTGCLMYSLYGVVVHSGSMHGGHYTSYVRIRSEISLDSVVKVKYTEDESVCDLESHVKASSFRDTVCNDKTDLTRCTDNPLFDYSSTENSQWYYISDTHVAKASSDDVLQSQAYLLFYERLPFIHN